MNKFVIAVYVDNKYGVLTRVTSMFTRRGFNIDALTVGETESPEYSRITISLSGDGYAVAKRGLEAAGIKVEDTPELLITENAYSVAKIAVRKYESGEYVNDLEIAPTYLRMPQAERERLERLAAEKSSENK